MRIRELSRLRRERGSDALHQFMRVAREGLLVRPDGLRRRRAVAPNRTRGDLAGPVGPDVSHAEEAVAKANNTNYGLACGVWSEKGSRTLWVAERLRAGVIWANTYNRFDPTSPFGGMRESGFGREGGRHGLEAYLDV